MTKNKLSIISINTFDICGGAEKISRDLFEQLRSLGYKSWMIVGHKRSHDPDIFVVPLPSGWWFKIGQKVRKYFNSKDGIIPGAWRVSAFARQISQPKIWIDKKLGHENYRSPGIWKIFDLPPGRPNIIHCHNLHGGYFDLRVLPWLCRQAPVILSLHDAWLLSGHCAHSFDCNKWQTGCGKCPDLNIPPAIHRDSTAYNWKLKKYLLDNSKFYIITPSKWLMDKVDLSYFKKSIIDRKVINNWVDTTIFKYNPFAKELAGYSESEVVIATSANKIDENPWKNFNEMKKVVLRLQEIPTTFLVIGSSNNKIEKQGNVTIKYLPFEHNERKYAGYLQIADIYLHYPKAEVWGLSITQAMACGIPVVAAAVGGIPEQVNDMHVDIEKIEYQEDTHFCDLKATGILVPLNDSVKLFKALQFLSRRTKIRKILGQNGCNRVAANFTKDKQILKYLDLYHNIIKFYNACEPRNFKN
jgi:glycosyltransferase involved in cell wall biosynthesis